MTEGGATHDNIRWFVKKAMKGMPEKEKKEFAPLLGSTFYKEIVASMQELVIDQDNKRWVDNKTEYKDKYKYKSLSRELLGSFTEALAAQKKDPKHKMEFSD